MRIQTSFLNRLYRPGLSRAILVLAVCAALIGSFYPTTPAYSQTAVTLLRLTAIGRINNILIEWETATEFNNAGFFVWASDSADGTFNPISDFIEAEGDGVTGAVYGFVDSDVQAAIPKYYKLEAIELNQESEFFGPVSAASNQGLPTTTLTATATSTISAPATQPAGAPTAAPTATARTSSNPTAATPASGNESAYPGQTTPTPFIQPAFNDLGTPYPGAQIPTPFSAYPDQQTTPSSIEPVPAVDATAALADTEPTGQVTPSPALTQTATGSPQAVALAAGNTAVRLPPFTALLVVLLIWAILAGWFFISVRHLE